MANGKHIVIKFPFTYTTFFEPSYNNYIKIVIIRNPYYIYSSLNSRFKKEIPNNHNINRCLNTIHNFMFLKRNNTKNTFFLKYEEMFDDSFLAIRNILTTLKISYDNSIFKNKVVMDYDKIPNQWDDNNKLANQEYRKWQLQQKYEYKDFNRPVFLTQEQYDILENSSVMKEINYKKPDIVNII
jgi:hypothetical protein